MSSSSSSFSLKKSSSRGEGGSTGMEEEEGRASHGKSVQSKSREEALQEAIEAAHRTETVRKRKTGMRMSFTSSSRLLSFMKHRWRDLRSI